MAATALLPLILVAWNYYQDRTKDIDLATRSLTAASRSIAARLDASIQAASQLHFGLARARDLDGHDKAACSHFLSEVLQRHPQFTGILTIKPDGQLFCDSLQTGRALDLTDRGYFKRAINSSDTIIVEPVFGRLTGSAVLQIAYPVRGEDRQLSFVLLASLDLRKFLNEQIPDTFKNVEIVLTDKSGMALLSSRAERPIVEPGVSIADTDLFRLTTDAGQTKQVVGKDFETRIWAASETLPISGVSLHVLVGRLKSELVAAPNKRLLEDGILLGILTLLLLAGAWLLAEVGIRSQISRIATMAGRLGEGDLNVRLRPPYPKGELGRLMIVLNKTATSLQLQRLDIEQLNVKLVEAQKREALEKYWRDVALDNMTHGLVLFDASERLVVCNDRYIEMFGVSPKVVKPGCSLHELVTHRKETGTFKGNVDEYCRALVQRLEVGKISQATIDAAGRTIDLLSQQLPNGGWVTTFEDVTDRRRSEERIAHLAHYDVLTDLPNRAMFTEQLDRALQTIQPELHLAVLYIDLDEFKGVNDSLGHLVGDELLKCVADRLRSCASANDFVFRLGGDEFAIIQTGVRRVADTRDFVAQIYQSIRGPFECLGHLLTTDASIGIALAPIDECKREQLLKFADLAMYEAKANGRGTFRFFEPAMNERATARRSLEVDLRRAIDSRGFELYYQPLVDLHSDRIVGCEALLRWRHPERGLVPPGEFIPVAEETRLINQLGEWVLKTACSEAMSWTDDMTIAVNVSPIQFQSPSFALIVSAALASSGLPARRLELEITEAILIQDDDAALATLHQLRALGVRIALDDFGTGYSSLSYLQRFPFDKIKIDRSFVKGVTEAAGSGCIVEAIVNIAIARGMTTTAEGVETRQQRDALFKLGCHEMQGFLFSKALPASKMAEFLSNFRRKVAAA